MGITPVLDLLQHGDFDIKREAAWVLFNVTSRGSTCQIEHIVHQGCLKPMIELLTIPDARVVLLTLDALEKILQCGKSHQLEAGLTENPVVGLIEEADGLDKMEALQESPAEDVYSKATKILETFFQIEDDQGATECVMAPELAFCMNTVPQDRFNFCFTGHSEQLYI